MENLDLIALFNTHVLPHIVNIAIAIAIFVIGRWVVKIIKKVLVKALEKTNTDPILSDFVLSIASTMMMFIVIIAALSQLGVDTTSFIALIGAAGLAIGLALQNSLQNFAAGVMIVLFKPFKTGDFIEAAGVTGVVEQVGIFTSNLKTGDNKQIIVPNGEILNGPITNYSAKDTRRVDMVFGIGYDDDLKKAKEILERLASEDDRILKDPGCKVALSELADSSVNFIVRPWVNSADYWAVMWDMNEKVKLAFDDAGISIPYPQIDLHMNKEDASK